MSTSRPVPRRHASMLRRGFVEAREIRISALSTGSDEARVEGVGEVEGSGVRGWPGHPGNRRPRPSLAPAPAHSPAFAGLHPALPRGLQSAHGLLAPGGVSQVRGL